MLDWTFWSRTKTVSRDLQTEVAIWKSDAQTLHLGLLWPCYARDALAAAPYYKDDSEDYTQFSEYQVRKNILEDKVRRQGARF